MPLIPSGLSESCPDVLGEQLLIRCTHGWGWTHRPNGSLEAFEDETLAMGEIGIIPERYVEHTTPRCGLLGRIEKLPGDYRFDRFLAFIMSDGCDYDFTDNIAPAWRIFVGDGELDLESEWFPVLGGETTIAGYGSVGRDSESLDRSEASWQTRSEQGAATNPRPVVELKSEGS